MSSNPSQTAKTNSLMIGMSFFPREGRESALKVVEAVQEAEAAGFDRAWIGDTQGIYRDPYVTLALCAERTERIQLGIAVTNPVTRHPTVTARAVSTLDETWPGRTLLGLGAGDTSFKHLGLDPLGPEECEEAVHCLRSLLAGEDGMFRGQQMPKLEHYEGRRLPIYLAANGPRMLRTAGRCADGVIASVGVAPDLIQYVLDSVREGAESAGRDPAEVTISMTIGCDISEGPGAGARERQDLRRAPRARPPPLAVDRLHKTREGRVQKGLYHLGPSSNGRAPRPIGARRVDRSLRPGGDGGGMRGQTARTRRHGGERGHAPSHNRQRRLPRPDLRRDRAPQARMTRPSRRTVQCEWLFPSGPVFSAIRVSHKDQGRALHRLNGHRLPLRRREGEGEGWHRSGGDKDHLTDIPLKTSFDSVQSIHPP